MCGIGGTISLQRNPIEDLLASLCCLNELQRHRGPDGHGIWMHPENHVGFAHRRLSIIDLATGDQPMREPNGNVLVHNGEIYNYVELREQLGLERFRTTSDTEVILKAYETWGVDSLKQLRGMFAFAVWDERTQTLLCARDRFGVKPFYYAVVDGRLYFASEAKALLPFLPYVETDLEGFKDYLAFQFCLDGKTLFKGIQELLPGHFLTVQSGEVQVRRYWEVYYELDWDHTAPYFERRIQELLQDSVDVHLRSDVPLGAYVSGGTDSSIVATLATRKLGSELMGFTGRFTEGPEYDESQYALSLSRTHNFPLQTLDISVDDFVDKIRKVIYHLDYPVAGPGSFPQYMVSQLAAGYRKVVLGGQGGDEIFGGYTRYLIAYFEQCIKAAIDGSSHNGNFVVTYESIIPNLVTLRQYKPLLQEFWRDGLFEPMDRRYFRLINRTNDLKDEVRWELLTDYEPFETFRDIFHGKNVRKESYFDLMTHFDFKTLLPALLQVEDRVSMAHGLESRVPFLDHALVELAATIPSDVKFADGHLKHVLRNASRDFLLPEIANRKDKMGFPTPLIEWARGPAREFFVDVFSTSRALSRDLVDNRKVLKNLDREPRFGRKLWGLLCLELWQQEFHDRAAEYRRYRTAEKVEVQS
ncbi:MAG: asparagine synthase (glutamine-hydrolyzing) [Candidatus Eremiobacterota bacterium]